MERRAKSMGNSVAAGEIGDERWLRGEKRALTQQIREENPQLSLSKWQLASAYASKRALVPCVAQYREQSRERLLRLTLS